MTDRIRIIKHEAVPKCGSYEVRYSDGRPSKLHCLMLSAMMPSITMTPDSRRASKIACDCAPIFGGEKTKAPGEPGAVRLPH
jgi:hypothetical protein